MSSYYPILTQLKTCDHIAHFGARSKTFTTKVKSQTCAGIGLYSPCKQMLCKSQLWTVDCDMMHELKQDFYSADEQACTAASQQEGSWFKSWLNRLWSLHDLPVSASCERTLLFVSFVAPWRIVEKWIDGWMDIQFIQCRNVDINVTWIRSKINSTNTAQQRCNFKRKQLQWNLLSHTH